MSKITSSPMILLNSLSVFPGITTVLEINRKQSMSALHFAVSNDNMVAVFTLREPERADGQPEEITLQSLSRYGVMGKITQVQKSPNANLRVTLEGQERVELVELQMRDPYLRGLVEEAPMEMELSGEENTGYQEDALHDAIEDRFLACVNAIRTPSQQRMLRTLLDQPMKVGLLMNGIVAKMPFQPKQRQEFLEKTGLQDRVFYLAQLLENEEKVIRLKAEIGEKVKQKIDQNQREYVLREQMKVLQEELGDGLTEQNQELEEQFAKLQAPQEVRERIEKEMKRLKMMPFGSQEAVVLRGYVETLLEMPWEERTEENSSIANAREILEADHYGLEKVKERVLEYLAVRNMNGGKESTLLCLAGPPGTGKTSIAKSVARALNRRYVRISLGGIHDEAEIRGHRKTYVGAMPGRIINAIRQAGTKNPLILLDELDKLGTDYRGDPASALLEVLDSEQNVAFRDHFLEVPFDLSEVIFIATANDVSTIPGPLRDRVELIEISSYTANEKFHIARQYLVDKQREKHGLTEDQLTVTDDAIKGIIRCYTREAGVRELERKIGAICRRTARCILEEGAERVCVDRAQLEQYLGKERYKEEDTNLKNQIGIVRGLAWTSVGGDTLEVEVNVMPGKGKLQLTGKLGDVMKESAQTALSYVRSVSARYNIPGDFFETHDIHLHVPEGAVPKDGPSAGITIATAILSAVTNRKIKGDIAMTGEITLRGRVLPIGGLKEKLLAAKTAGMKCVLVPVQNEPDVKELSEEITEGLDIRFVGEMDQVLSRAFA